MPEFELQRSQVALLVEAFRTERAAPDLLPYRTGIIEYLKEQIVVAEAGIEAMQSKEVR